MISLYSGLINFLNNPKNGYVNFDNYLSSDNYITKNIREDKKEILKEDDDI